MMGTNFYLERNVCSECGRPEDSWHIGKSSAGWCFGLRIYPDRGINDLHDWIQEWNEEKTRIMDEYGREKTKEEMLQIVTVRKRDEWELSPWGYTSWEEFHRLNHSQEGPNNMLRHRIDDRFCVGHGEGTWDLMLGEFS
jgi:hypothetical protein